VVDLVEVNQDKAEPVEVEQEVIELLVMARVHYKEQRKV
jgi:hypothetical protein